MLSTSTIRFIAWGRPGPRVGYAGLCLAAIVGCGSNDEFLGDPGRQDGALFVAEVYPMLLRDCAFSACHGAEQRFLHLYGPGRARLDPASTKYDDPLLLDEVMHGYERARSMIATAANPVDSLLLTKPLEIAAGGQGHAGIDQFDRNLFGSARDPRYELLLRWARSNGAPPSSDQVDQAIAEIHAEVEALKGEAP